MEMRIRNFLYTTMCHWISGSRRFDGTYCFRNVGNHEPRDKLSYSKRSESSPHPAVETSNLLKITKFKHVVDHIRKTHAAITECSSASTEINNSDSNLWIYAKKM